MSVTRLSDCTGYYSDSESPGETLLLVKLLNLLVLSQLSREGNGDNDVKTVDNIHTTLMQLARLALAWRLLWTIFTHAACKAVIPSPSPRAEDCGQYPHNKGHFGYLTQFLEFMLFFFSYCSAELEEHKEQLEELIAEAQCQVSGYLPYHALRSGHAYYCLCLPLLPLFCHFDLLFCRLFWPTSRVVTSVQHGIAWTHFAVIHLDLHILRYI